MQISLLFTMNTQKKHRSESIVFDMINSRIDYKLHEGLSAMGNQFIDKPFYSLGQVAGMVVKDPQYLLLSYFRIPKMASGLSQSAAQMAAQAARIQPKYVQQVGRFMQNSRIQAGIGRGVEAATYGGVYEALHDLTFKGSIDAGNVKRGAAFGALSP